MPARVIRSHRSAAGMLVAASAVVVLSPAGAKGVDKTWVGLNGGSWNTASNWSPAGVPSAATTDNVTIAPGATASYFVNLNTNYPSAALGTVTLNSANAFLLTLNHTSASFTLRAGTELIATTGIAAYNQSAGSNVVTTLILGDSADSTGTYTLSGAGSLTATTTNVGNEGAGTFLQSGGSANLSSLRLGFMAGATGSYQLSGGTLSSTSATVGGMGLSSSGIFVHSGGNYSLTNNLTLGFEGTGSYFLIDGSLSSGSLTLGLEGTGSFTQTGGACTSGGISIGYIGQGSYSLQVGTLSASSISLGGDATTILGGVGQFSVSGGSATVTGTLKVYDTPGNSINLSGGTLSVGALNLSGQPSFLNWTGGTLRFASGYTIDPAFVLGDFFHLQAGRTLAAGAPATISSALYLDGGTLSGTAALTNNASLQGYGTLAQPIVNSSTGNIELYTGHALAIASGFTLSNAGAIQLNTGTIAGGGTLSNTGILSGPGAVSAPLSNTGTIALPSGSLSLPSFTNAGLITLDSAAAQLTGGTITNTGTLQGRGRVTAPITNTGIIESVGGVLELAGALSNPSGGRIRIPAGTKLLLSGSFPTNAGTLLLSGGTLDTNGQALTNTGSITGNGLLAGGTLTNSGVVLLTGGPSTVPAPVVNTASHTFTVQNTPALFTSSVTNNGTFQILNTTATFAGGFSGNAPSAPGSIDIDATGSFLGNSLTNTAVHSAGGITLRPASQGGSTSTVTSLTLDGASTFDLADNDLFINYASTSPVATIRQYLLQSHLVSSVATADDQHRLALGYAEASAFAGSSGGPAFPDLTSMVVTLTYYGDANLDGTIDADDFTLIDRGLAMGLTGWVNGDFNYDNVINTSDYLLIDRVYGQTQGLSPAFLSMRESQFGEAYVTQLLASIPEPASLSLLSLPLLATRRRRR